MMAGRIHAARVVIAGFYPPPFGGESIHVLKLVARLRSEGIPTQVVNLSRDARPSPAYVNGAGAVQLWQALLRLLSSDALLHLHTHGHSWRSWMIVLNAACVVRLRSSLGVLTLHSGMSPDFIGSLNRLGRRVVRSSLAAFTHVVCVSDDIRQALVRLGVPEARLSVVPAFLGVASHALEPEDARSVQGWRPLLSVVGGIGPEYGVPLLIEALERLRSEHPDLAAFGCVVMGTDGTGRPTDLVRTFGLTDRVRFVGSVAHERCLALIARSDVFVRPSLTDGDAVSVREALAMGVPVVASDAAARPEDVTVFRAGDRDDLTRTLASVLRLRPSVEASGPRPDFGNAIVTVYRKAAQRPDRPAGLLAAVRWVARSLRRELTEFRVDYPIEIVPAASEPGSLRYHLYSDTLFLDDQQLDGHGVPLKCYRLHGPQYNPLFVAWWGLHHLERAARERDERHLGVFMTQLGWLKANAVARTDGAVVWPCYFDWPEGRAVLRAPWVSAMYQGVVISALVRGFRLGGDAKLLELARAAVQVFTRDVADGGVRTYEGGRVLYEEYPAFPLPRILDGFLFALLGLHDLYMETRDEAIHRLFADGVQGLASHLEWWSHRGKWSWYGAHGYLSPPHYHALNRALLVVLSRLSGETKLRAVAQAWAPDRLSRRERAELFVTFVVTKNWARARFLSGFRSHRQAARGPMKGHPHRVGDHDVAVEHR
jgi:glycosyltransferase involved in cell wall biosynthesis